MKMNVTPITVACLLTLVLSTQAQVLMVNFVDNTPIFPSGSNLTNSPYHTATPSFTEDDWNYSDRTGLSSLVWADGTAATGVTLDTGKSGNGDTSVGFGTPPSKDADLGVVVNTGAYLADETNASPGTAGMFDGNNGDVVAVAAQFAGLAAGTYDVYITGRNTAIAGSTTLNYTYYAGVETAAGAFNYSGYDSQSVSFTNVYDEESETYTSIAATDSWVQIGNADANYAKFTVTLADDEVLNVVSAGGGSDTRGFLNSVQIVSVPEPAAYSLLFGFSVLACVSVRRRKR
ncbi:MAG: PEP-CTERM sorting domain-containing protein [Verrucomicrobiales bacterium]